MRDNIKKYSIEDEILNMISIKNKMIENCNIIIQMIEENKKIMKTIGSYDPLELKNNQYKYNDDFIKYLNRKCWFRLVEKFNLKKYMLCSDYDKMTKDIEDNKFPEFNRENSLGWIRALKETIYENVTTLCKKVFKEITEEVYFTGSSYTNIKKKKRNNNGVDKFFILSTSDYYYIFDWSSGITITDDIEKCLYILAGEKVPEIPCKDMMRKEKKNIFENDFFKIKVHKSGNTHYWIKDEKLRDRLNLIGAGKGKIGENIKIKIFEERRKGSNYERK